MRAYLCFLLLMTFCLLYKDISAQEPEDIRTGKFSAKDFNVSSSLIDSSTGAVVLTDLGKTSLETYEYGWRMVYKRVRRIKILGKSGYGAAAMTIRYSAEDNGDGKLKDLKAYTYNLKDGSVETTPVPNKDLFLIRNRNSDILEEKFAFPNVQVGSVLEYSYTIRSSDIDELVPWDFQGAYPRLVSAYSVVSPALFSYITITKGTLPFYKTSLDSVSKEIWVGGGNASVQLYTRTWVMRDVPALHIEPFINSMDIYTSKIQFQISRRAVFALRTINILPTWQYAATRLLANIHFGVPMNYAELVVGHFVDSLTAGCQGDLAKARKLFAFVRDSLTCSYSNGLVYSGLDKVLSRREGNTTEINLLMTALLRKAGFHADPVILSTKENGPTNFDYPVMNNINYVVVCANIGNKTYYLDAATKYIGFGKLPLPCYNGHARVIAFTCFPVYLEPDSVLESSMTSIFVNNDENGGQSADITYNAGYYESLDLRGLAAKDSTENYFRQIAASFPVPAEMKEHSLDSLKQYDQPLTLRYSLKLSEGNDDILYFNPMLNRAIKVNPFLSETRAHPIELPSPTDDLFILDMAIPKGYNVEEIPKSARVNLNGDDGSFEYVIAATADHIQLRCRLTIKKSVFQPEDYQSLRDFYSFVIKKENETIVFKKN